MKPLLGFLLAYRKQIIGVLAALIGVVLVFSLPKVLVDNDKEAVKGAEISKGADTLNDLKHLMGANHTHEESETDLKNIQELTKNYYSVSDKEKKRIFADSISTYYKRFHQYDSVAKYQEEIASLETTGKSWVNAADAYMQAADFAPDQKKPLYNEKSRVLYNKALAMNPDDLETKSKLAMTYVASTTPMEGIKILREVIEKDPNNETALFNLGYLSMQSGQYSKAVDRFKKLIEVNPQHSTGMFYLGLSYSELGNKQKARDCFEKAKTLDKDPEFQSIIDSYLKDETH